MKIRLIMLFMFAGLITETGAELFDRGGGMIYDDVLDITWLQDANLAGRMYWADSLAWADGLSFGGFDDWRLASMDINQDDTIVDCDGASELACRDNELGYMYYQNLIGSYGDDISGDQGFFTNIQAHHWSGTELASNPSYAWVLVFANGGQGGFPKISDIFSNLGAWAVRDGDVGDFDADDDGIPSVKDNCVSIANQDQRDTDNDGHGNACDFDYNNDCVTNFIDLATFSMTFLTVAGDPDFNEDVDFDGNGVINFQDFGSAPNSFGDFFGNPPGPSATNCDLPADQRIVLARLSQ